MSDEAIPRFDGTFERLGTVLAPDGSPDVAEGVLNPAAARSRTGDVLLYPRCVAQGNRSRIGLVRVRENGGKLAIEKLGYALEPEAPYERRSEPGGEGCEDPRVTFIPVLDCYVMTYTAFGPIGPRIAVALSRDGYRWERLGLMDFSAPSLPNGDDKDAAFFPEPVRAPDGTLSFALYHRPMLHVSAVDGYAAIPMLLDMPPEDRESIAVAYVPLEPVLADARNLLKVALSCTVLSPHGAWGRIKLGAGTPPVRIDEGWFSIFHGVDAIERPDGGYGLRYSAGFVIHDADNLARILYRSDAPDFVPQGVEELAGTVANVVFPTGIVELDEPRTYDVYYGMADTRVGRARLVLPAVSQAPASEHAA